MFDHKFKDSIFSLTEMSYAIDPATNYLFPGRRYFLTYAEEHEFNIKPNKGITYDLNGDGHRSEEFVSVDPTKTNILFAGCSSTFGEGIPEDTRWTNRVHSQFDNAGPLQVLGYPGGGADRIVSNIFKYFAKFGNPDYLFIMFADFSRHMEFNDEDKVRNVLMFNYGKQEIDSRESMENLLLQFQNYYRMLEIYCKANNIKLYTSSWDSLTVMQMDRLDLKTFKRTPFDKLPEYFSGLDREELSGLDKKLYFLARDGHHDGTIRQKFVGDQFMKRVLNDKKD
jgi:hypothetical protein